MKPTADETFGIDERKLFDDFPDGAELEFGLK